MLYLPLLFCLVDQVKHRIQQTTGDKPEIQLNPIILYDSTASQSINLQLENDK